MTDAAPAIPNQLKSITTLRRKIMADRRSLTSEISQLDKAGIVRGSIRRAEKRPGKFYAYLHHDPKHGEREPNGRGKREYLGTDDDRIAETQAAINRGPVRDRKAAELDRCNEALAQLSQMLSNAARTAQDVWTGQYRRW